VRAARCSVAAVALLACWLVGPAADAATCGGQKADVVGGGGDSVLKSTSTACG
jgi:hypothetical protein